MHHSTVLIVAKPNIKPFDFDGKIVSSGGFGKGATVTITANGRKVAGGRLEKTVPQKYSIVDGLDVGIDTGSPVDFGYRLPFEFTGKIEKVVIDLK